MSSMKTIHIVGIGGIGMSAIAQILHHFDYKVQGSDVQSSTNTNRLSSMGIQVYIGHSAENINSAGTVVYSSAIKSDNVELVAARISNKLILNRAEILVELLKEKYVIAVSGSSGKTTTTAMISSIFDHSNTNATVLIGGILNSCKSNTKYGSGKLFLIEADESDGTMLKIPANIAVITSINSDHVENYGTFDELKKAFSHFLNKSDWSICPYSGNIDYDEYKTKTFGIEGGNIKAENIRQHDNSIEFDVLIHDIDIESVIVLKNCILSNAVGIHKVSNALAAISVGLKLGISEEDIKTGLLEFKGVERRFCLLSDIKGVKFIEDYAHHPVEIYATLKATHLITKGKIFGIIELNRFTRIRNFFDEYIQVFSRFDYVVFTPVHSPEDLFIPGFGTEDIKNVLMSNGFYNVQLMMNDPKNLSEFIKCSTKSGDIVLFLGAGGNITKLAKETTGLLS